MTKINKEIKIADTPSKEKGKQQIGSKAEKVKGVKQKVVEESADVVHLVLPQNLKGSQWWMYRMRWCRRLRILRV